MSKFSRGIFAAAFAVGIVSVSFGATTSISRPDGLKELTIDTASRVTTTATTYAKKIKFSVSDEIATTLGAATMTNFPVLVRLSSAAVENYDASAFAHNGRDLYFEDENGTALSFELDTFDSAGETLVWVKIPSLSASTKFTCYYGGPENILNNPTDVWTGYLGVWHYNGQQGGVTPNATANADLDGSSGEFEPLSGANTPFGSAAVQAVKTIDVQDYELMYNVGKRFSASGWFKVPTQDSSKYSTFITKKSGLSWNATSGWYLEMSQSKTKMTLIPSSGKTAVYSSVPDVTANWNYFTITHDNGLTKVYLNGGTSPVISQNSAINVSSTMFKMLASGQQGDEYRLSKSTWSALRTSLEYKSMKNADFLSNSGSSAMDATAPVFETPVVQVASDGSATMTFTVTDGEGEVSTLVGGEKTYVGAIGTDITLNEPKTVDITIDENACVEVGVYGINTKGTEVTKFATGAAMNAAVEAVVTNDANERGLIPGVFTVSRPNGVATDLPIIVNLSWEGGSAVQGKNYLGELPASVTIPAGATSTTVVVTPLRDAESDNDETIILKVVAGAYKSGATATMKILNLVTDPNYNTWVAVADGLASDAANWSKGVPNESLPETLVILLDGNYSSHDMTWDADSATLAKTVSSWTQTSLYTGTVTINTEFPTYASASFTCLTVTDNVVLQGGSWTHPVSIYQTSGNPYTLSEMRANAHYRMKIEVKGDMSIASAAKLNADSKGYWRYATGKSIYGSHGGFRNSSTLDPYGDVKHPVDIGSCTCAGTDSLGKTAAGGGAIHLVVGGTLTVNGVISADGNNNYAGGSSAGSVYVEANAVTGAGSIHANGVKPTTDKEAGAGGRVAVIATTSVSDTVQLAATAGGAYYSGAGTVYVKTADDNNGRLYIANTLNTQVGYNCRTPITDGDWTFDAIYVDQCAKLCIGEGKTLTLPNGLASVHGGTGSAAYNGILLAGGTLAAGDGDQTMSGKWTFESTKPYTFPGNLTLENGARLGLFRLLQSGTNNVLTCDYTVNGDLTIGADSSVDVSQIYHSSGVNGTLPPSLHGGWSVYDNPSKNYPCASNTYDSVFHPHFPGMTPNKSYYGSGVLKLQVAGVLTVDGTIGAYGSVSDSTSDNIPAAPGGSIDIVAGSLSGSGKIDASGAAGRYNYAGGGGGGRIAVRLTDSNADFSSAPQMKAQGQFGYAFNAKAVKFSSAGSVYLQTASEGEKKGTMIVSNFNRPFTDFTDFFASGKRWPTTPIVAYGPGSDAVADFKDVSLVVTNTAIAEVSVDNLKMKNLEIAENSKLDLFGNTLTVKSAKLGDTTLAAGTYAAGDVALGDFVSDSVGGGSLVVQSATRPGLRLILR